MIEVSIDKQAIAAVEERLVDHAYSEEINKHIATAAKCADKKIFKKYGRPEKWSGISNEERAKRHDEWSADYHATMNTLTKEAGVRKI